MKRNFTVIAALVFLAFLGWKVFQVRMAPPLEHVYLATSNGCAAEVESRFKMFALSNDFNFKAEKAQAALYRNGQKQSIHNIDHFYLDRWNASISAYYDFNDKDPSTLNYFVALNYGGWLWPTASKEVNRLANTLVSTLKASPCVRTLELVGH